MLFCVILIYFPFNKINRNGYILFRHISECVCDTCTHSAYSYSATYLLFRERLWSPYVIIQISEIVSRTESSCHMYTLSRQGLWILFNDFWLMLSAWGINHIVHWRESNRKMILFHRRYLYLFVASIIQNKKYINIRYYIQKKYIFMVINRRENIVRYVNMNYLTVWFISSNTTSRFDW